MRSSIILFFLYSVLNNAIGQEKNLIVIKFSEFSSKELNNKKLIRYCDNDFFRIQIADINTLLYKVTFSGENFEYQTEMPVALKNVFGMNNISQASEMNNTDENKKQSEEGIKSIQDIILKMEESFPNEIELIDSCKSYLKEIKELDGIILEFENLKDLVKSNESYSNLVKAIPSFKSKIVAHNKKITRVSSLYTNLELRYEKLLNKSNLKRDSVLLSLVIDKFEKSYHEHEQLINKILIESSLILNFIANESNFKVTSTPIQMGGDFSLIKTTIEPIDNKSVKSYTWDMKIFSKSGLKVDFSVGPSFHFTKNSNNLPIILEIDSIISKIIKNTNKDWTIPRLAAMMHFYKRMANGINVGGVFGINANFQSLDSVNVGFLGGISLIFGRQRKVFLNMGISAYRVTILQSSLYKYEDLYKNEYIQNHPISISAFKPSFFVSLSYRLTNKSAVKD